MVTLPQKFNFIAAFIVREGRIVESIPAGLAARDRLSKIFSERKGRVDAITLAVSDTASSLYRHFEEQMKYEFDAMNEIIMILKANLPELRLTDEEGKFRELSGKFDKTLNKLRELTGKISRKEIKDLDDVDIDAITEGLEIIDESNELWSKLERYGNLFIGMLDRTRQVVEDTLRRWGLIR